MARSVVGDILHVLISKGKSKTARINESRRPSIILYIKPPGDSAIHAHPPNIYLNSSIEQLDRPTGQLAWPSSPKGVLFIELSLIARRGVTFWNHSFSFEPISCKPSLFPIPDISPCLRYKATLHISLTDTIPSPILTNSLILYSTPTNKQTSSHGPIPSCRPDPPSHPIPCLTLYETPLNLITFTLQDSHLYSNTLSTTSSLYLEPEYRDTIRYSSRVGRLQLQDESECKIRVKVR